MHIHIPTPNTNSVQPEWEKARQLVEIARMRLHSRLLSRAKEQEEEAEQQRAAP